MDNRVPQYLPPPGYLMPSNLAQLHQTPPLASPPLPHNHSATFSAPHLLTLRNTVPAKRGSDEVQFVSSNPVKKRKMDGISSPAPSPPPLGGATPTNAPYHLPPLAQAPPTLPVAASIPTSTPHSHCEADMSKTVLPQASTGEDLRSDALRGASEPILSIADFSNMWTAPSRGPKSSPAVSPKQMPPHIPQLQIGQDSQKDSQPIFTSNQSRPEEAPNLQGPTPSPTQGHKHSPSTAPTPAEKENRDIQIRRSEPEAPSLVTQLDFRGLSMPSEDSERPVESSHSADPSGATVKVDPPQHHQPEGSTTQAYDASVAVQAPSLASEPVVDSITVATSQQMHETAPQQDQRSSPSQPSFQGQQQAATVQCQGGPLHSAKSNCYHCFQAWLKRNGALVPQGASFMTPTAKPQMVPYQLAYQQQWPQQLGMGGFSTPLQNAATYAQLLRQQSPGTQEQRLQHQQHASTAPAVPVAPMMANMSGLSASTNMAQPSMWNAQSGGLLQNPPQSTRPPQNHPNGKHIIVDMAETCLESFPFEDFAQRHNQPPKRVREIFEAIIQMPMLRCPTDKRRAGKVATAKMKEYTQAKKNLQAQMTNGQTQNQGSMPQPSAWEMAQYLGPSDVPIPGHLAFPGPW